MQFETIRAAAVAVKNAILIGVTGRKVAINDRLDEIHVGVIVGGAAPSKCLELADISEFLEETKTFCDNTPYCPPALEYLRGFATDEAPELFVDLLRELLEEAGGVVDDA